MKNLAILIFLFIGITSCSKDSLDPGQTELYTITKSEILVTVTNVVYTHNQCGSNCGVSDQTINYVPNASVNVYRGNIKEGDQSAVPLSQGRTDSNGKWLGKDLEPGLYTVMIQSTHGQKSRVLYTQLNQRSSIEFSF